MDVESLDPWLPLTYRLAKIPEEGHPTRQEVARLFAIALPRLGAPEGVQNLLTRFVKGGSDRPRGTPQKGPTHWARVIDRRLRVYMAEAGFRRLGVRAPVRRARQVVAEEEGIKPDTLKRDLERGLRGAPWGIRTQGDKEYVRAAFDRLLEQGEITLDTERGFVWL